MISKNEPESNNLEPFPSEFVKGDYYEYYITVTTQEHGCEAKDTIKIIKSESDISIDKVSLAFDYPEDGSNNPQEFTRIVTDKPEFGNTQYCENKQPENVTITIKNSANIEVAAGETISLYYSYFDADNNTYTYHEDTIMVEAQTAGATFEYAFKQVPDLSLGGIQNLTFFARINADMKHDNDSAVISVNLWPLPIADLRDDSLLIENPIGERLNTPEIDGATYKWQDNSNENQPNSFEISESNTQKYWVEVADQNSCGIAYDTILIVSDKWRIDDIVSPSDQCAPMNNAILSVSISNLSVNNYPRGYEIPATITVNGKSTNDVIKLENDLAAGNSFVYQFRNTSINMSEAGKYSISVHIKPIHDINNKANGKDEEFHVFAKDINIWGEWEVNLGAELIYTLEADTITLIATGKDNKFDNGKFMSYYWSTAGSTEETSGLEGYDSEFSIPSNRSETYSVYVEDFHGCPSSSAEVTIMPFDLGITEISSPKTSCDLNGATTAELKIYNNSKETIEEGTTIFVYVQTDNGNVFEHEQELPEIAVNQSQQISFNYIPTFIDNLTNHTVKMWISWENDIFHNNDTLSQVIQQYAHPDPFDLGNDIYTTRPDTVQLVAPQGYRDYIWSDNSTGSNILNVSYSGTTKYWVRVINGYGCATTDSISIITTDLTMSVIGGAANSCSPVDNDNVTAQIKVNRNNTVPAGTSFTASYECNGFSGTKEIVTDKEITYNEPFTFNFDVPVTIPDTGDYTLRTNLTVHNSIDVNKDNNNASTTIRIGALQLPFKDTVRTYDDMYIIDAGSSFTSFNWVDNPFAEQRIAVVSSGLYTVSVIDTNGCANIDSTFVLFVKPSYEIRKLGFASTMCAQNEPTEISFYIKNTGNDLVTAGTVVPITYKIDNNQIVEERHTLTKNLAENDSLLINFNKKADLRETGSYTMLLSADVNGYSTTSVKTITIMENPSPDLGDDIKTWKDSWQLTPGINYGQFLWNTGETNYYIDVTQTGKYWVTVTNNFGCSASDTVNVSFIQPTVTVYELKSPKSACSLYKEPITINIVNNSTEKIEKGNSYEISCIVDNDSTISITGELTTDFEIKSHFDISMNDLLTTNRAGKHTLAFTISIEGSIIDQSEFEYEIYGTPEFELKDAANISFPYSLAPTTSPADATYEWNTGARTKAIDVTENGTYTLKITDSRGCSAEKSVTIKTTDINNSSVANIAVYPNPAKDILNIDFGGQMTNGCQILIANASGRIIFASKQTSDIMPIAVDDWAQGIYFIKITSNSESRIIKFVKE